MFRHPSNDKEMIDLRAQEVRQIIAQSLGNPPRP